MLKRNLEDLDATELSPPILVDKLWHYHILDTRSYAKTCENICGEFIHHDRDGGLDEASRNQRMEATKLSYQALFGKSPKGMEWDFWHGAE